MSLIEQHSNNDQLLKKTIFELKKNQKVISVHTYAKRANLQKAKTVRRTRNKNKDPILYEERVLLIQHLSVPSLYRRLVQLIKSYKDMFLQSGFQHDHSFITEINKLLDETKKQYPIKQKLLIKNILFLEDHIYQEIMTIQYDFNKIKWITLGDDDDKDNKD